jgi:hypothetical protein
MIDVSHISKVVLPLLAPFQRTPVLFAGEALSLITNELTFSEPQNISSFSREQLEAFHPSELAVVTDLTETLPKTEAMAWLGLLKNKFAQHIVLVVDKQKSFEQNWQFADFLGLGFKLHYQDKHHQVFFYAIESYQIKKDWLNARFWANPENFDKYRW